MDKVIITIAGHQYQVKEGDVLDVPYQANWQKDSQVTIDQVMALLSDQEVKTGSPYLDNVKVKAKILDHFAGPKISQINYKAKSRYRRRIGSRQKYTRLTITKIDLKTTTAKTKTKTDN